MRSYLLLFFLTGCVGLAGPSDDRSPSDTKADGIGGTCAVPGVAHQRVFSGLSFRQPVTMLQAPGDTTRFFVAEHTGAIKVFDRPM